MSSYVFVAALVLLAARVEGSCDVDPGAPTVWLGDEQDINYCQVQDTHCSHFGLDFVCEDPDGGSLEPCQNGTKIKCMSPAAAPLPDPTAATTIRVLAYNVFELRYLYAQNGQRERTCRIPETVLTMLPDLDVIVFNEVFMGGCFSPFNDSIETSVLTIRDILDQRGFVHYTETVGIGQPFPLVENGGIFIASRWPIVQNDARVFNVSEPYSFIAKGVAYTMINKTVAGESRIYHVFGTHMQAFRTPNADNVRVAQATIIHNFMLEQNIPDDEPVIYAGDLNARLNTTNGDEVVDALDATLARIVGEYDTTYDHENNDMFNPSNSSNYWLDYVLFSRSHLQPTIATTEVIRPRIDPPLEICWSAISAVPSYPNSPNCRETKNITDMSDHYAVLGTYHYANDEATPPANPSVTPPAEGSCDVDPGTPTVWLGDEEDANRCQADPIQCSNFGLDFVCEDPNGGDFGPCDNGTKVLCASPPALPLAAPTPVTTFRVINYNVWELRYLVYQSGQRERTCRIPREVFRLHPDADVIVFNEVFMGGCFSKFNSSIGASVLTMRDILAQYGFVHYTETVGDPPQLPKVENGGVFIVSRWPIVRTNNLIYNESIRGTADNFSGKGAVYVRVMKTVESVSMMYNVLGTHLQATQRPDADEVRVSQATEMHELMLMQGLPINEPVIYAGDLNAKNGTQHFEDVLNALDSTVPDIIGPRIYTYDGVENDLLTSTNQSWIDYVVHSKSHLQPTTATLEVVRPRSPEPFDVCMLSLSVLPTYPDMDECRLNRTVTDLADHYAVMGVFDFSNSDFSSTSPTTDDITTSVHEITSMTTESGTGSTHATTTLTLLRLVLPCVVAAARFRY